MSIKLLKKINGIVRGISGDDFFIVGGAVRDTLYGAEPKDYDCVLCAPYMDEVDAHHYLERLAEDFAMLGCGVRVYQSYGLNLGEEVNPTSFQAMFLGCMKVSMNHCELDILISSEKDIRAHVKRHDCNMNMVWFDGQDIRWEHGGLVPKVETLVFHPDVCEARIARMDKKRHALVAAEL